MDRPFRIALRWLVLFLVLCQVEAFYIPGWTYKAYSEHEAIPLLVNKVYSDNTQLQYAYNDLPFVCKSGGKGRRAAGGFFSGQSIALNLGEVLRGDRITVSDMELSMLDDRPCNFLCSREVTRKDVKRAKQLISDGYLVEWIVDNLPGATSFVTVDGSRKYYAAGFKLGYTDVSAGSSPSSSSSSSTGGGGGAAAPQQAQHNHRPRYFLNNHHTIVVRYRKEQGKNAVVGFEVYPKSIGPSVPRNSTGCPADLHHVEQSLELYIPPSNKTRELTNKQREELAAKYAHSSYYPDYVQEEEDEDNDDGATLTIPYTYTVLFREDKRVDWRKRWDLYFVNQEEGSRIHWLAIVNSLIICGLLTGIVVMILARTVRSDIKGGGGGSLAEEKARAILKQRKGGKVASAKPGLLDQGDGSNDADDGSDYLTDDEALEDVAGWKQLHADVFRRPRNGHLLAPLVGSGMQLLFMAVGLVLLSALGILNPSFRGGFISFGVGLFVFAGLFSGYYSARVYKTFGGQNWKKNTVVTALLFPGLLFGVIFVLNLFVWAQASSTALPFGTLVGIVALWLCIQLPLVYVGSWYGFVRRPAWEHPTKTSAVPRQIPRQAWYIQGLRTVLLAGLIPFAVIFVELLFVFQSVWQDKSGYYYVFGFLAVVSGILVVTVAEVTVVTIYIQLCGENYHWWWQSFLVGGGSAVWVFAYCVWYYFMKLHITGFLSSLLFFSYSFMACCVYGLLTGTIGFLTAYTFVRRIYGAIKAD